MNRHGIGSPPDDSCPRGRIEIIIVAKECSGEGEDDFNSIQDELSFNSDRMANSHRQVVNDFEDESDYVDVTKSELKTVDSSTWDDETNNSDSDVKSKFDEAFSEGSTTSSAYKDGDHNTEVELRVRVRRFDEENACLRDELVRVEELANDYQRQLHLLQERFDQMREKYEQLVKENDEQKEKITTAELQERRDQVLLQKLEKERNALLEKLNGDKEMFNGTLEQLNRDKLYCHKKLAMCEAKLEEKEILCVTLQKNLDEMNELITGLEENYENKIRCMQDKSDDLTSENVELKMRLLTLDCPPPSLDQEVCLTSTRYLDSSDENLKCRSDQKVQLEESLYAELKASGFSIYDKKCESKIRELELEADWCNSELVEAGREIDKLINIVRKTRRYASRSSTPQRFNTSQLDISPILLVFDRIKELSHEVSEALRKPSTTDSSSQVSADSRITREHLKEFCIPTFEDYLRSPIKVSVPKEIKSLSVFLTCKPPEIKDKIVELAGDRQLGLDIKNNVTNIEDLGSSNAVGSMSAVASASHDDISSFFVKIQSETKINSCTGEVRRILPVGQGNLSVSEVTPVDCSIGGEQLRDIQSHRRAGKSDMSLGQKIPRRKISVFQRSFDIDTVFEVQDGGGVAESHTLSERCGSMTDSSPPRVLIGDDGDDRLRIEGVTGYRSTTDTSQLSDSSGDSPARLTTWTEEDHSVDHLEANIQGNFLAPARLKLDGLRGTEGTAGDLAVRSSCRSGDESNGSGEVTGDGTTSVTHAMSSGEDSSDDSESDSTGLGGKLEEVTGSDRGRWINNPESRGSDDRSGSKATRDVRDERAPRIRRSMSDGEIIDTGGGDACRGCSNGQGEDKRQGSFKKEVDAVAFPSLTNGRLQESGIAQISDSEDLEGKDLTEEELERKFVAFSLGLCTDRVTLPRRRALALRQRDYTEHDLAVEIAKMHQSIQEFAPLCFDSETVERIELACHQVDIIAQCAHRVSCTAETLGAIQQEHRISRAISLADRFLKILRSRCEKLGAELAEKKRVLAENNIVIDEGGGEGEGISSAVRYRALSPTTNRTMMARRRASIATIFRPIGIAQEVTKDNIRQRNSVSGRVTIRRPSFSSEPQRFEAEKLTRTDSSSVGELREIFEQAESRRTSREENNNLVRSQMIVCENETVERRMSSSREEPIIETLQEEQEHELHEEEISSNDSSIIASFSRTRLTFATAANNLLSWRLVLWCAIITFFIGFYVKDALSITSPCSGTPLRWWSFEEVLSRHAHVRNTAPPPI
ncbi:uncharacterized protein LOC135168800 isoform X2 [Diachasmimorpha longicaudata]|uniref:uncharacterized protein LOC135168800 isoform X2 n=1 Tax=Diachasmimorpha longicaudata TaxID=58733 RepID=UPI0030B89F51